MIRSIKMKKIFKTLSMLAVSAVMACGFAACGGGGDEGAGYVVDYSLSYSERYVIVRDYYLAIADPAERMALYTADEVAKRYLDSYYGSLYNVLYTYSQ